MTEAQRQRVLALWQMPDAPQHLTPPIALRHHDTLIPHRPNMWPFTKPTGDSICLGRVGPLGLLPYVIPVDSRNTHMYVIGTTGQGKSKFLESLLVADIRAGRGCGLVDPHTDLARDTLTYLLSAGFFRDPSVYERVIYFDPTRTDYVIPFNVLKLPLPSYVIAQ